MNNSTAQSANKPGDTERGVVMRGQKQTTKLDIMQHRNTALEALIWSILMQSTAVHGNKAVPRSCMPLQSKHDCYLSE